MTRATNAERPFCTTNFFLLLNLDHESLTALSREKSGMVLWGAGTCKPSARTDRASSEGVTRTREVCKKQPSLAALHVAHRLHV